MASVNERTESYTTATVGNHGIIELSQASKGSDGNATVIDVPTGQKASLFETNQGEALTLSWCNVGYTIEVPAKAAGAQARGTAGAKEDAAAGDGKKKKKKKNVDKTILSDINGVVRPGEMVCIMGTSGSGKTSMLNCLSGRHIQGKVTGDILLNGKKRTSLYRRQTAYVEQDDVMFPHLTVRETMYYTARLRMPRGTTYDEKIARADEVMQVLGLSDCKDTRIGSAFFKGISGGERKRTSIGIELITNPRVLFLDEPTSGLDAFTAFHIMETIRDLARGGRSVVCTIHQPRETIFELFDKLLLLTKGRISYYGPRNEIGQFMTSAGHGCPANSTMADFLLDVMTVDTRSKELTAKTQAIVDKVQAVYETSTYGTESKVEAENEKAADFDSSAEVVGYEQQWNLSWWGEFTLLLSRAFKNVTREPKTTKMAISQQLLMALIVGGVFVNVGREYDQVASRDREGVLFFVTLNQAFIALQTCVLLFHSEKQVFNRERNSGAYRVSSYFSAKTLADTPLTLGTPLLHCIILYFMVGLNTVDASRFFLFLFFTLINIATAQSFGIMISAAAPSLPVAQALAPTITILLMLFGGFYLNTDSIWVGFRWIEIFSFMQYTYNALMVNEFKGLNFTCSADTFCLETGQEVLVERSMGDVDMWEELGKLFALMVGFRILGYLALRFMHRERLKID